MNSIPQELPPLLAEAIQASAAGQTDLAIRLFGEAANISGLAGWAMFLLGAEYAALGRLDEAEASFTRSVLHAPELDVARYQLGLLQFSAGRLPAAFLTWKPLLADETDGCLREWIQGFAALARDDLQVARGFFESGIRLNLHNPPMSRDIEHILSEIEKRLAMSDTPAGGANSAAPEAEETDSHVLIANYKNEGTLH